MKWLPKFLTMPYLSNSCTAPVLSVTGNLENVVNLDIYDLSVLCIITCNLARAQRRPQQIMFMSSVVLHS